MPPLGLRDLTAGCRPWLLEASPNKLTEGGLLYISLCRMLAWLPARTGTAGKG